MKLLVLTTKRFAPTHNSKLLNQIKYLESFSDMHIEIKVDLPLADIEHLIMNEKYDCVYPTTVFQYLDNKKSNMVFNRTLYQILDYYRQEHIGSELFVHMLMNDKALTCHQCGHSLPQKIMTRSLWEHRNSDAKFSLLSLAFPVIIKPNTLAASIGITTNSIAYSLDEAYNVINNHFISFPCLSEVLLESYLVSAEEFTVSVTGNGNNLICSSTAIKPREGAFELFSYTNKNLDSEYRSVFYSSDIDEETKHKIETLAMQFFKKLNIRDYSRFDFLKDESNKIYLIDANSLPSLGDNYFLEHINNGFIIQEQVLGLLLVVFCKRMNQSPPSFIREYSKYILDQII